MGIEAVLSALFVALAGTIVPATQYLTQRKLGLTPAHERLISLLETTIQQQEARIRFLEGELAEERRKREALGVEVNSLRQTVTAQAVSAALKSRRGRTSDDNT